MAMRITTKMMQSTSLNNINTNKALQEKLTTQMSTQKKITRPSTVMYSWITKNHCSGFT